LPRKGGFVLAQYGEGFPVGNKRRERKRVREEGRPLSVKTEWSYEL